MHESPSAPEASPSQASSMEPAVGPQPERVQELPAFARNYPDDPKLQFLVRCFELGRYDVVRRGAKELAEQSCEPRVVQAARELQARLRVDPLAIGLLLAALGLLVFLSLWAFNHAH